MITRIGGPTDVPHGRCRTCGMSRMSRNAGGTTEEFCPRCDTAADGPPTTWRIKDMKIKEDEFKLVVNSLGNLERVPADDTRQAATNEQILAVQEKRKSEVKGETPVSRPMHVTMSTSDGTPGLLNLDAKLIYNWCSTVAKTIDTEIGVFTLQLTELQLINLSDYIQSLGTPPEMKEARKTIKLLDQIDELINQKGETK